MALIVGIALKDRKWALMKEVSWTKVTESGGLEGDFRGKGGITRKRQVTVLSIQQWEQACKELGVSLPWHTRRANFCVEGLTFGPEDVGKILHVGFTVDLEITGETKPCERMGEAYSGLKNTLSIDWRGGVTCRVRKGGVVAINSPVELV